MNYEKLEEINGTSGNIDARFILYRNQVKIYNLLQVVDKKLDQLDDIQKIIKDFYK